MNRIPPTLDMTPDGGFRTQPSVGPSPSFKLLVGAALVAIVAGGVALAAFALWLLSMTLPVLIVAGAVAWGTLKFRRWQSLRGARSLYPR